jgi:hypothetical protein
MVRKGLTEGRLWPSFRRLDRIVIARDDATDVPRIRLSCPRMRASSTSQLLGSIADASGILDRPVKPSDDGESVTP